MFFYLPILFRSIIFFAGFEAMVFFGDQSVFLVSLLAAYTFYTAYHIGGKFIFSGSPVLLVFSVYIIFYLIDSLFQRQVFVVISFFMYYLSLFGTYRLASAPQDRTAKGMIAFTDMATAFFLFSGIYGLYLNFTFPLWSFMLAYCLSAIALSYHYFYFLYEEKRLVFVCSLIIGFSMAELAWMMNFWPFGYLTTGISALIFYYMEWYLVRSYFLETLSQKRMIVTLVSFMFLLIMVLSSSRWLPVV